MESDNFDTHGFSREVFNQEHPSEVGRLCEVNVVLAVSGIEEPHKAYINLHRPAYCSFRDCISSQTD